MIPNFALLYAEDGAEETLGASDAGIEGEAVADADMPPADPGVGSPVTGTGRDVPASQFALGFLTFPLLPMVPFPFAFGTATPFAVVAPFDTGTRGRGNEWELTEGEIGAGTVPGTTSPSRSRFMIFACDNRLFQTGESLANFTDSSTF